MVSDDWNYATRLQDIAMYIVVIDHVNHYVFGDFRYWNVQSVAKIVCAYHTKHISVLPWLLILFQYRFHRLSRTVHYVVGLRYSNGRNKHTDIQMKMFYYMDN